MAYKSISDIPEIQKESDAIYFGDSPLWTAATSGDKKYLEDYFKNGGKVNQRFEGFGNKHSLLLGAARNQLPEIVKLLESYGETTLSPKETNELSLIKNKWGWETPDYAPIEIVDPNYDWKQAGYDSFDHYVAHTNALDNIYRAVHNRQKELDTNEVNYRNKKTSLDDWLANNQSIYDKYQQVINENYNKMRSK